MDKSLSKLRESVMDREVCGIVHGVAKSQTRLSNFTFTWTAKRSNQSILKDISPEYSLDRLMFKLKLKYFGHLKQRIDSLDKTPILQKIEGGGKGNERR